MRPAPLRAHQILRKKLRTFANLPWSVIFWLVPAWVMLAVASLAIAIIPFRHLASMLGNSVGETPAFPTLSRQQMNRAERIRATINIAARYAPFRSNCYPQTLVAAIMCRLWKLPYAIYFGIAPDATEGRPEPVFRGHVWLVSGRRALTGGGDRPDRFKIVACFASMPIG